MFLAFAGMETTRNQLGLALQTLLQHPDQWRRLGEQPHLGANAVEEVMRVNPTVTWVTREALADVHFHGLHIPKGGIVQMLSHAAGTDPRAVPDPTFDIREVRTPHHGFGAGVHHCLGHFVARTDMAVALPLLAARMPDAVPMDPASGSGPATRRRSGHRRMHARVSHLARLVRWAKTVDLPTGTEEAERLLGAAARRGL